MNGFLLIPCGKIKKIFKILDRGVYICYDSNVINVTNL